MNKLNKFEIIAAYGHNEVNSVFPHLDKLMEFAKDKRFNQKGNIYVRVTGNQKGFIQQHRKKLMFDFGGKNESL